MKRNHICYDIETLALTTDAAVASIGAVAWTDGDAPGTFRHEFEYVVILEGQERRIDPGTVRWWLRQSEAARRRTFEDPQFDLAETMRQFGA